MIERAEVEAARTPSLLQLLSELPVPRLPTADTQCTSSSSSQSRTLLNYFKPVASSPGAIPPARREHDGDGRRDLDNARDQHKVIMFDVFVSTRADRSSQMLYISVKSDDLLLWRGLLSESDRIPEMALKDIISVAEDIFDAADHQSLLQLVSMADIARLVMAHEFLYQHADELDLATARLSFGELYEMLYDDCKYASQGAKLHTRLLEFIQIGNKDDDILSSAPSLQHNAPIDSDTWITVYNELAESHQLPLHLADPFDLPLSTRVRILANLIDIVVESFAFSNFMRDLESSLSDLHKDKYYSDKERRRLEVDIALVQEELRLLNSELFTTNSETAIIREMTQRHNGVNTVTENIDHMANTTIPSSTTTNVQITSELVNQSVSTPIISSSNGFKGHRSQLAKLSYRERVINGKLRTTTQQLKQLQRALSSSMQLPSNPMETYAFIRDRQLERMRGGDILRSHNSRISPTHDRQDGVIYLGQDRYFRLYWYYRCLGGIIIESGAFDVDILDTTCTKLSAPPLSNWTHVDGARTEPCSHRYQALRDESELSQFMRGLFIHGARESELLANIKLFQRQIEISLPRFKTFLDERNQLLRELHQGYTDPSRRLTRPFQIHSNVTQQQNLTLRVEVRARLETRTKQEAVTMLAMIDAFAAMALPRLIRTSIWESILDDDLEQRIMGSVNWVQLMSLLEHTFNQIMSIEAWKMYRVSSRVTMPSGLLSSPFEVLNMTQLQSCHSYSALLSWCDRCCRVLHHFTSAEQQFCEIRDRVQQQQFEDRQLDTAAMEANEFQQKVDIDDTNPRMRKAKLAAAEAVTELINATTHAGRKKIAAAAAAAAAITSNTNERKSIKTRRRRSLSPTSESDMSSVVSTRRSTRISHARTSLDHEDSRPLTREERIQRREAIKQQIKPKKSSMTDSNSRRLESVLMTDDSSEAASSEFIDNRKTRKKRATVS